MLLRKASMIIFMLLLCSMAYGQDNSCAKALTQQSLDLANPELVELKDNAYLTKGLRATKFQPADIWKLFDAFNINKLGELELYSVINNKCVNIGAVSGDISYMGVSSRPFQVSNGNFRRASAASGHHAEITLYNTNTDMIDFSISKNFGKKIKYYQLSLASADDDILVTATSKASNVFENKIKNLPDNDPTSNKPLDFVRVASENKKDACSKLWFISATDAFVMNGKCKLIAETAYTLMKGNKNIPPPEKPDRDKPGALGMDLYDEANDFPRILSKEFDVGVNTQNKWLGFFTIPDPSEREAIYLLQFYGNPRNIELTNPSHNLGASRSFKIDYSKHPKIIMMDEYAFLNPGDSAYSNSAYSESLIFLNGINKLKVSQPNKVNNLILSTTDFASEKKTGEVELNYRDQNKFTLSEGAIRLYDDVNRASWSTMATRAIGSFYPGKQSESYTRNAIIFPDSENKFIAKISTDEDVLINAESIYISDLDKQEVERQGRIVRPKILTEILKDKVLVIDRPSSRKKIKLGDYSKVELRDYGNGLFKWDKGVMGDLGFDYTIYDDKTDNIRLLKCRSKTGVCTLDGRRIFSPRAYLQCESNSQCDSDKRCVNSICVNLDDECKTYINGGDIDFYIFGVDMQDGELRNLMDSMVPKLLNTKPFNDFKDDFTIKYKALGHVPNLDMSKIEKNHVTSFSQTINQQKCGNAFDVAAVLTPYSFRDFVVGKVSYIAIKDILDVNFLDVVFVHEFGHSFANLADEYTEEGKKYCKFGINCATKGDASKYWSAITTDEDIAKKAVENKWFGCGACDIRHSANYVRPSFNSIMNNHRKSDEFNKLSEDYIRYVLGKYTLAK